MLRHRSETGELRVLVLAPDGNPDSITTSLVGYAHSEALARCHKVTVVVRQGNEEAVRRAGAPFHRIEAVRIPGFDEFYAWSLRRIFKYDYGSHALTAFNYPFALAFEWCAWRLVRARIRNGEFDVVLRVLPVSSVMPSPFAFFLRRGPIPFVVGPINGGLPWPPGFSQAERQKEWITRFRNMYRVLPFSRSTYRHATAIIAGSSHTFTEFETYSHKMFFVPENGVYGQRVGMGRRRRGEGLLELIYVGRLVPYKACDLALRAAAPLIQSGKARLSIVGDGSERMALEDLAKALGVESMVSFCGWLSHEETLKHLQDADVLVFPSVREFGGGVVFEALASGVVPVVAAFGGPGDIVGPDVGYTVPLTSEGEVVAHIQRVLAELEGNRELLKAMSEQGMRYAREQLSWDGKAQIVTRILRWAAGQGPKPELPPPRRGGLAA
jgi:glycosyltransferase involved in cell wall biosynthesis